MEVVRWIFDQFLILKSESKLVRQLNRLGIPNKNGQPWNRRLVHFVLINENYIGNTVYNRISKRLKQRAKNNPEHMWVRGVGAVEPIIEPIMFQRVQQIMKVRRVSVPKEQMLALLRATLIKRGRLTTAIINETPGLPSSATYMDHFGTLRKAYKLIGYTSKRDCDWIDAQHRWSDVVAALAERIAATIRRAGGRTDLNSASDCVLLNKVLGLSFRIARVLPKKQDSH